MTSVRLCDRRVLEVVVGDRLLLYIVLTGKTLVIHVPTVEVRRVISEKRTNSAVRERVSGVFIEVLNQEKAMTARVGVSFKVLSRHLGNPINYN